MEYIADSSDVVNRLDTELARMMVEHNCHHRAGRSWQVSKASIMDTTSLAKAASGATFATAITENSVQVMSHDVDTNRICHIHGHTNNNDRYTFNRLDVEIYADSPLDDEFQSLFEPFLAAFPEHDEDDSDDSSVSVNFRYLTGRGPENMRRSIEVPSWEEIHGNYSSSVQSSLDALMKTDFEDLPGKLILWSGIPGSGKTYAIRSLLREWKDDINVSYIMDTEALFSDPSYMLEAVFDNDNENDLFDIPSDGISNGVKKTNLFVLEDAGELLRPDAKEQVGQGLSRLLNLADGMIGQGLKVLILITTNEEVSKLHPAVARSGRCAHQLKFHEFSAKEASDWLEAHGKEGVSSGTYSLADLYALKNGDAIEEEIETAVGFG